MSYIISNEAGVWAVIKCEVCAFGDYKMLYKVWKIIDIANISLFREGKRTQKL